MKSFAAQQTLRTTNNTKLSNRQMYKCAIRQDGGRSATGAGVFTNSSFKKITLKVSEPLILRTH
jgi:hypothetical protein